MYYGRRDQLGYGKDGVAMSDLSPVLRTCLSCHGSGARNRLPCMACKGSGLVWCEPAEDDLVDGEHHAGPDERRLDPPR
ncbi:hypothetical protein JCM9534A_36490 [Catenuloplanes indicus JCM 9534]